MPPAISLITEAPSEPQRRVALITVALSVILFVALVPFTNIPIGRSELFLPTYESALVMCDIITCIFLFGQFGIYRWPALLILASGYLFSATMALMHELSFPGLFTRTGLLWAHSQTTAWIYFIWHLGFPAAVIGYALTADRATRYTPRASSRRVTAAAVIAALALAVLGLLIATAGARFLPRIMNGNHDLPAKYAIAWFTWLVTFGALPFLWRRVRFSGLDLWLLVVVFAWSCDVGQAAVFNAGRFSLGWYTGRAYGLAASSFLLAVLILESGKLHRRLVESHVAEREQRKLAQQRTVELNKLTDSLEERVRARTKELENVNQALRRTRDELRNTATLGVQAREEERARMARELHDELDQTLIMLKFELADLESYCREQCVPVPDRVDTMRRLIDTTIDAAKRIATDLRPAVLDMLGLTAATQWLIRTFQEHHAIDARLHIDPQEFHVEEPYATVVFRILQEALTNIVRHASASRIEIDLAWREGWLRLRVTDDGHGFDVSVPRRADAFGLLGMRERVTMVSGSLDIISSPGNGTTVMLLVPLEVDGGAPLDRQRSA